MSSSSRSAGDGQDGSTGGSDSTPLGDQTLPESAGLGMAATMASGGAGPVSGNPVVTTAAFPVPNWDRYEFMATLGRGGMGSVYKARDRRLGRIVALKFIHGDDPGLIQRFLQEARAQARLASPHICKIHEAGFVDSKPYIAMELVEGASLDKAGPALALGEKVQIMRDVALAMHVAHEEGIIHRDLKPSNIMLERLGGGRLRPVVMDFGLARDSGASVSQGLTESGAVIGTPAYMSPEQARGEARRLDRRSDVYSLGATLYDLLSGKPPFQDETIVNLLIKVVNEPPTPLRSQLPDVPEALDLIISKCLNKEAEQRYPTALALAEDLDRYLSAGRVLARRLGYGYRLRYFARRNRAMTALGVALITAAIALLVVGIRSRLVALRKDREAREQAALAQTLGQSVKDLEWLVRTAYLLPLHDTRYEKGIVRSRMAGITQDLAKAGESGARLGAYVLGRGHLALHEWDRAHEQLKRAEQLGYRDAGLDYALGRVLGEKYSRALDEARKSGDKSFVAARKKELEAEFLNPARQHLQRSRGQASESPSYVEALLDFYNEHYDAALLNAHMARRQAPWLYEALKLEGDVHMVRALAQRDHGDNKAAERSFAQAVARYEEAAAIGHSDPQVHEALAEAWIRQEEMDLYRGVDPTPKMERALAAAERAIEAEPEAAGGYIKQASSYVFGAQHALRGGDLDGALQRCQAQAAAAQVAIALDRENAIIYDIHGNAYRCISEIDVAKQNFNEINYQRAKSSLERSIQLYPKFSWALNDLAGLIGIAAQQKISQFEDPRELTARMISIAKSAIAIDANYIAPYQQILIALELETHWLTEHGINIKSVINNAEIIANAISHLQQNYAPTLWDIALIHYRALQYHADQRQLSDQLLAPAQQHCQQIRALLPGVPDVHALAALVAGLALECGTACQANTPSLLQQGRSAIENCYQLSSMNSECRAAEIEFLSMTIERLPKNQHISIVNKIISQITIVANQGTSTSDHQLICAKAALKIVSLPILTKDHQAKIIELGLLCSRALLRAPSSWPRARALHAGLSLQALKLRKSIAGIPSPAGQVATDFATAFAGNPLLRIRFGELAEEAKGWR